MPGELPFVSGVRSQLIEEQIQETELPPSAKAIILFGTATQGPLHTPVRITPATAEATFGISISDPYQRFNLMKGFHELNGTFPRADVIAVRIGNAKKAKLDLFEHQVTSGEFLPQSGDTLSISLEALVEGNDGNAVTADIYGNDQGLPTRMIVTLPTGNAIEFDLANSLKTPSTLAAAMNADDEISQFVKSTPNVLTKADAVTIVAHPTISGQIQTVYALSNNNILDITAAYIQGEFEDPDSIPAGRSSATLKKTPTKDSNPLTATIEKFYSIIKNEDVFGPVEPDDVGTTDVFLDSATDPKYDNTETFSLRNVVVRKKDGATGIVSTLVVTTDYAVDMGLSKITLVVALAIGDQIFVDYEYLTTFEEANVRSVLEIGNPYSYFVGGNTIVFGATQTNPVAVVYDTKNNFTIPGDVGVRDLAKGEIRFNINENSPDVGDVVTIEFVFEPELPAPNRPVGTLLPSGKRQASQLTGGSDGRITNLPEYFNELAKGYAAADNIPFLIAVPQGVYVDDVMDGVDFETGLASSVNAGFHDQLRLFLTRHSVFVSECIGIMAVKPMDTVTPSRPTLEEREAWYDKLVNVSANDVTRPANIVSTITDYHMIVPAGDFIWQHPNVNGGRPYVEGGQNMFAGMKFFHDNLTSVVTRTVPKTVIRDMVYKIQAIDKIDRLVSMRYTLFTEDSDTGNFKAAAAPTMAAATSQFRRQYNLDITIEAVNNVRRVLKPFIGQPNKPSVREAMNQAAKQELQIMTPNKLMAFDIQLVATRSEAINGRLQVDLTLTTAVEISQIHIRTRLQLGF